MSPESQLERATRRSRRLLFDRVAALYDTARPACTDDVVDHLLAVAGLTAASRVLEVGCGTGQLTERLAARGVQLTAIDIGAGMVAAARRRVASCGSVDLRVTSYEELVAEDGTFDLIVSADAFHWVLQRLWRSDDGGAWLRDPRPTVAEALGWSEDFAIPSEVSYRRRLTMSPSTVLDLENTRATSLSWSDGERRAFIEALTAQLPAGRVHLTQVATVAMAQVVRPEP